MILKAFLFLLGIALFFGILFFISILVRAVSKIFACRVSKNLPVGYQNTLTGYQFTQQEIEFKKLAYND